MGSGGGGGVLKRRGRLIRTGRVGIVNCSSSLKFSGGILLPVGRGAAAATV